MSQQRFSDTFELDRTKIRVAPKDFQGRQTDFSNDTVAAIVAKGYYDKSAEPIIVWQDDQSTGIYYVISGHSRFEATRQLYAAGQKNLATIPVKQFNGNRQEAQEYAVLESNRGGTEEGLLSDIKAFKLAKKLGKNRDWLRGNFRPDSKFEKLEKLSYLADNGRFIETLTGTSAQSFPYIERNAVWVGTLRKALPALTDAHENEIFVWLYQGDRKALAMSKDKFMQEIDKRVNRIDFDPTKPLNFANSVSANPYTDPLNDEIKALENEIERLSRERDRQLNNLKEATKQGKTELLPKFQQALRDIDTIVLRKLQEQDSLRAKIGKMERETVADLFSEPAPEPAPPKPTLAELNALNKAFKQFPGSQKQKQAIKEWQETRTTQKTVTMTTAQIAAKRQALQEALNLPDATPEEKQMFADGLKKLDELEAEAAKTQKPKLYDYNVNYNVGKSKYVVNWYNGKSHNDGSPFYDVATFNNKQEFNKFVEKLKAGKNPKAKTKTLSRAQQLAKQQAELTAYQSQVTEAKKGGLTQAEVLRIARKINSTRRLASQVVDGAANNAQMLEPTFENLKRWASNPGKYDLVGVDTKTNNPAPTKTFKKDYQPKKETWWSKFWNG